MHRRPSTLLVPLVVMAAVAVVGSHAGGMARAQGGGGQLAGEWDPGYAEADLGGDLTVDGYGIGGLGAYPLRLDDGSIVGAVCVQADLGHSLTAPYRRDATPATSSAELAYLLWRYLRSGVSAPSDDVAAAINVLAWRYVNAARRGGGTVWQGEEVDVVVAGVGHLAGVEEAVVALRTEASARRGPWILSPLKATLSDSGIQLAVRLAGPGGPIAGERVTFELGDPELQATTDGDGLATVFVESAGAGSASASAEAEGPGAVVTWSATGSQRVAVAGPPVPLTVSLAIPPAPTTTLPATTTTLPPTTTVPPTTSTTSTTVPPTTSTTSPPTTTVPATTSTTTTTTTVPVPPPTTAAPPALTVPPTLPRTGESGRSVVRWGSVLFALGALGVLLATGRVATSGNPATRRGAGEPRRRSSR